MNSIENYLEDIAMHIMHQYIEIQENVVDEFSRGKALGYYEIISRLQNQAIAFGLDHKLPKEFINFNADDYIR